MRNYNIEIYVVSCVVFVFFLCWVNKTALCLFCMSAISELQNASYLQEEGKPRTSG